MEKKLVASETRYYVKYSEDNCGYTNRGTYIFFSVEEVEKLLGIRDGIARDVYGEERVLGYHQIVMDIYAKTEYKVEFEFDDEAEE